MRQFYGGSADKAALAVVASSNNGAAANTLSGSTGNTHVVDQVIYGYSATPGAGATFVLTVAGTTSLKLPVTAAGPCPLRFDPPIDAGDNVDVVGTLAAGGAGVFGYVNFVYR